MNEGILVALQLVYEASTCCTSIVVEDDKGVPHHMFAPDLPFYRFLLIVYKLCICIYYLFSRTMDWELDFLEPLTIEIDFQRGGKTLYVATSWAGYGTSKPFPIVF